MTDTEIRVTAHDAYFEHELIVDGDGVSSLAVVDLSMRIGTASVRMGGIAGVGTGERHRRRGYARRLLENSTAWMTDNGFDCAVLFGIPDFYDKFGYAVCLPECRFEVRTRHAERAAASLAVRRYAPADLPAVQQIYAANNADLTGSIVRSEKTSWFHKGSDYEVSPEVVVFTEADGAIASYAARDPTDERMTVCEAGARRPEGMAAIVRWAADRAVELRLEKVRFLLPPDSPLGVCLARYGAEQTLRYPRNGEGMGRILRLESFLQKTLPEWTRQARAACTLPAGTTLRVVTDLGGATLRWTGDQVELDIAEQAHGTVRLPQSRLMQLMMGYYGAATALSFPDVETDGDLSLLYALFPRRLAYMWVGDHF